MLPPLSTYKYSDNATKEEEIEQSNSRLKALREIADYIDKPCNNQLCKIIDKFLKECSSKKNYDSENIAKRYNFFKNAFQAALEEQRKTIIARQYNTSVANLHRFLRAVNSKV